jgi:hypothetical protein
MSVCGSLFFVIGLVFLLQNLKVWTFWGIQWYTALFIIMGLGMLTSKSCPDCCKMRGVPMKGKK